MTPVSAAKPLFSSVSIQIENKKNKQLFLLLQKAVRDNQPERLESLLAQQTPSINGKDKRGYTLLGIAAQSGHRTCVQHLLKQRAVATHLDEESGPLKKKRAVATHLDEESGPLKMTALHLAAQNGHDEIIDLLLEHGADPNIKNSQGDTPLGIAAKRGHLACVQSLLKKRDIATNIDARNGLYDKTALYLAVELRHYAIMHCLLEHKADPNITCTITHSPLGIAARCGDLACVQYLLEKSAVNIDAGSGLDHSTALYLAAKNGRVGTVDLLLKYGADPNITNADNYTLLGIASSNGHKECVQYLLENHTGIHCIDAVQGPRGMTAAQMAAWAGHIDVMRCLLEHGADPNITNHDGCIPFCTLLCLAANDGHLACVQYLLEQKTVVVNINARDGLYQMTALYLAARNGDGATMDLLLKHGADPNIKDVDGCAPLGIASSNGHKECVQYLLENHNSIHCIDAVQGLHGMTALQIAAEHGHVDVMQCLLEHGADPNIADNAGRSILCRAANNGHLACVQYLLEQKTVVVNINAQDSRYQATALYFAAKNGHVGTMDLLLKYGADPNITNVDNYTLLGIASSNGYKKCVQYLLENHNGIHCIDAVQGPHGMTAAQMAAWAGHIDVMRCLLEHGADPNIKDGKGYTLLGIAAERGKLACVQHLLTMPAITKRIINESNGPKQRTALFLAARNGHDEIMHLLLEHGADLNIQDVDGYTLLGIAAKRNHPTCVGCLLTKLAGTDCINERNGSQKNTALHLAAKYGHYAIVSLLLTHGADLTIKNDKDYTPLGIAVQHGFRNCVQCLLEKMAMSAMNVDERNGPQQQTALHLAVQSCLIEVVQLLLEHKANVAALDANAMTPIDLAAQQDTSASLERLLETWAHTGSGRETLAIPLCLAAQTGSAKCFNMLLDAGADINSRDLEQNTPLHRSALADRASKVALLLERGAAINAQNSQKNTPLHLAAKKGCTSVIARLLQGGAERNLRNDQGKRPFDLALQNNQLESAMLLFEPTIEFPDEEAWLTRLVEMGSASELLETRGEGADAPLKQTIQTEEKFKPLQRLLHFAASFKNCETWVEKCLNAGVPVDIRDEQTKNTALHVAVLAGYESTVALLLRRDADREALNQSGIRPLYLAMKEKQMSCVKILLEAGARIEAGNEWLGRTVWHLAIVQKATDVLDLCIKQSKPVLAQCLNTAMDIDEHTVPLQNFLRILEQQDAMLNYQEEHYGPTQLELCARFRNQFAQEIQVLEEQVVPCFAQLEKTMDQRMNQLLLGPIHDIEELYDWELLLRDLYGWVQGTLIRSFPLLHEQRQALNDRIRTWNRATPTLYDLARFNTLPNWQKARCSFYQQDIFPLLSTMSVGFAAAADETDSALMPTVQHSYLDAFGASMDMFYTYGMRDGRDLVAIGATPDIGLLLDDYATATEVHQVALLEQLSLVYQEMRTLMNALLKNGYTDPEIEALLLQLQAQITWVQACIKQPTSTRLQEKQQGQMRAWERLIGKKLIQLFFSQKDRMKKTDNLSLRLMQKQHGLAPIDFFRLTQGTNEFSNMLSIPAIPK